MTTARTFMCRRSATPVLWAIRPPRPDSATRTERAGQSRPAQVDATCTHSYLVVASALTGGKYLEQSANLSLPLPAGAGGVDVTVQSNSLDLKLGAHASDAGTDTII